MAPTMSRRNETRRMDALLALPLERFRRALTELTPAELELLETRIAVQSVKSRWARGSHGIDRHRVAHDLGLLSRRAAETRREHDSRQCALTQLRLMESPAQLHELARADWQDEAA